MPSTARSAPTAFTITALALEFYIAARAIRLDTPADTKQQLAAFLVVLGEHRRLLKQQREDIGITLAEIAQHEERCCKVVGAVTASAPAPRRANRANPALRALQPQGDTA